MTPPLYLIKRKFIHREKSATFFTEMNSRDFNARAIARALINSRVHWGEKCTFSRWIRNFIFFRLVYYSDETCITNNNNNNNNNKYQRNTDDRKKLKCCGMSVESLIEPHLLLSSSRSRSERRSNKHRLHTRNSSICVSWHNKHTYTQQLYFPREKKIFISRSS